MHRLVLLVVLIPFLPASAPAEGDFPVRGWGKPAFAADVIAIPEEGDSVQVDVIWEVPYRELAFRKPDEYYRARYDVSVVFFQKGRQVGGDVWERRVRVRTFSETRSADESSKGRKSMTLPSGRYEVRIAVTDRTARSTAEATGRLEAEFRSTRIGLSDLRFVRYTEDGAVANPGREVRLGEAGHRVRITLHPDPDVSGPCDVSWTFTSPEHAKIETRDSTLVLQGTDVTFEIPVPSELFAPGLHRLDVRLEAGSKDQKVRRRTDFYARLTPEWFVLHRDEAFDIFEIIGTDEEVRQLRRATAGQWEARVAEFWRGRDPTPATETNEYRESIQLRVETAASSFREPFRPGWKTDRGKILLEHGQPDRRTVNEGGFDTPATELWEYDSPRRVFVFVDSRGTGEFWLRG